MKRSEQEPKAKFPFRTLHIFFPRVLLERPEMVPERGASIGLNVEAAFGVGEEDKTYMLFLKLSKSSGDALAKLEVRAVAVFKYTGARRPAQSTIERFANERLMPEVMSRIIGLVASNTNQMGMPPIWLTCPVRSGLKLRHGPAKSRSAHD